MPWIAALAILVIFTGIHIALARHWRLRLPERIVPVFWRWPWSPKEPTNLMSRRFLLLMGPLGAPWLAILGGVIAGTTHSLWVDGVSLLFQLEMLREIAWSLRHTAEYPHNQMTPLDTPRHD